MVHSNKGKSKYYCNTRYLNEDNTGCVTSVLDETLEGIIINEFNQIKENRLDAKKVLEEQEAEKNLKLYQYEERLRELNRSKEDYANRVMGFYEAYRDGSISQEEYLRNKEAYDLLQIKVDQDIEDASDKVKELRKLVTIGLEVLDLVDKGMQLKKLDRALVERLIERVVVGADEIEVEWKFKG